MAEKYTVRLDPKTESDYQTGTIEPGGYKFDVLAYPEPSVHGIDNGRISKLHIWDGHGEAIVEYERGWSVDDDDKPLLPSPEEAKMIEAVKREFPGELTKEQAAEANYYTDIAARMRMEAMAEAQAERDDDDRGR